MGKKETDEEKRKRKAMESIARLKSALGSTSMKTGAVPSLKDIKGPARSPEQMEEDLKSKGFGGSSKMKRSASDDTADGIMGLFKKKRK